MRMPTDAEIEKMIAERPEADNKPLGRRPTTLELKMGVRRANEWKEQKAEEERDEEEKQIDYAKLFEL